MDKTFIRELKARAHHLNPVILVGAKGLTDGLIAETNQALMTHELIKIKIHGQEREDRATMAKILAETLDAQLVQLIGSIAILYRENEDN